MLALLLICRITPNAAEPPYGILYEDHDWFGLRDAVDGTPGAPALYLGAVALAFNDLDAADRLLRKAARESGERAIEARTQLITLAQLQGDYGRVLDEIRALKPLVPDASGLANGERFFGALSTLPRQAVRRRGPGQAQAEVTHGTLFVQLTVDAHAATYIVDTGANFSVMSESEARRLGLEVRDAAGARVTDAGGSSQDLRVASADRVSIAGTDLSHVVFEVIPDDRQPFVDLPEGSRGVLGLPVLLALQTVQWDAARSVVSVAEGQRHRRRGSNLCLDGANPTLLARHDGRLVRAFLDTGASRSHVLPRFAREFPEAVDDAPRVSSAVTGVAGSVTRNAARLTDFHLDVDGRDLALPSVDALLDEQSALENAHAWVGLDLFAGARSVTLDFMGMRVSVR